MEKHIDKTLHITNLAAAQGHQALILPVHHPELNPMELGKAMVTHEWARLLLAGLSFRGVRQHRAAGLANIAVRTCRKLYETVRQTDATYWKLDAEPEEQCKKPI